MVLREEDSIIWMISARERQITCKLRSMARKDKSGCGIVVWGIYHLAIYDTYFRIYFTFTECRP